MKSLSLVLAFLAVIGIVVQPIAPAYAARSDGFSGAVNGHNLGGHPLVLTAQTLDEFILDAQIRADVREKLASYAARGEAAILSRAQMDELARTQPALYGKLMSAYRTASVPKLTADEKKLVDRLTAGNIEAFKAGTPTGCQPIGAGTRLPPSAGPRLASADSATPITLAGTEPTNCSGPSNLTGAWVIVGLFLTVIIVVPLFCAIAAQLGTAPAFCRGISGP